MGVVTRTRFIALALALQPALAFAQLPNTLQPPPRVAPISPSTQPTLPRGVDTSRDNSLQTLNRQLDASSRRVSADTLREQVDRQDRLMEADRARTDARRAAATTPAEAERIRQDFEARRASHEAWRAGKEAQVHRLETIDLPPPPPVNEVKPAIEPRR
ncbi:hypothetical protein LA521A_10380 [Lysobacter auxotrophicus]|uniref:Uncharacterized protein n=1 Tax=Lysobacter auxotrophicus TaxID=2992573 RepID=A0ABM8DBC9_9GAMM|nr:hypothetical protein LA521A_10380 [Lysobacter auxotrophicus]